MSNAENEEKQNPSWWLWNDRYFRITILVLAIGSVLMALGMFLISQKLEWFFKVQCIMEHQTFNNSIFNNISFP